jgi:hypothetical protein
MIDLEGRIADLAIRFLRPRRGDVRTSHVVAAVEQWVISQAKKQYEGHFDFRNPSARAVADARDAAASLRMLMARITRRPRKPSAGDPAQITCMLEALEPDFPVRMLMELRRREGRSATFANDLGRARACVTATALSVQLALRERGANSGSDTERVAPGEGPSIILRDNREEGIGVVIIIVLLVSIAIWYFDQLNDQKDDDSDDNED